MASESEEVERWSLPAKLRNELELALAGRLATSPELDKALAGDIGAVEFIWRSIADGTANLAERDIWVEAIAKRVVATVIPTDAIKRPLAANRALGFTTYFDDHWAARNALEAFDEFLNLETAAGPDRRSVARVMMSLGYFGGPLPRGASAAATKAKEESVMKIVSRLRASIAASRSATPPEE